MVPAVPLTAAVVHQLHLMDRVYALPGVDAVGSSIDRALAAAVPGRSAGATTVCLGALNAGMADVGV